MWRGVHGCDSPGEVVGVVVVWAAAGFAGLPVYQDPTTGGPLTGGELAANVAMLLAGSLTCISAWSAWPPPATPRPLVSG